MASSRKKPDAPATDKPAETPAKKTARKPKTSVQKTETGVEPEVARKKRTSKKAAAKPGADIAPADIAPASTASSREYDLVIVESPAKAKTINKYLGSKFKVLASYGHVRDLATGRRQAGEEVSGVKIADGWKLRYLVDAGSRSKSKKKKGRRTQREILDELMAAAAKANRVLLASDPDREGESIAWHIADELKLSFAREALAARYDVSPAEISLAHVGRNLVELAKRHQGGMLRRLTGSGRQS